MNDRIYFYNFTGATVNDSFLNSLNLESKDLKRISNGCQQKTIKPPTAPKGARAVKLDAAKQIVKSDFEFAKMIAKIVSQKINSQKTNDFNKSKVKTMDNKTVMAAMLEKAKLDLEKQTEKLRPAAPPSAAPSSGKKIERVSPDDFEKIWALKNAEKTASFDMQDKIIEELLKSGTQSKHASISGAKKDSNNAFDNDFLSSLKNVENTGENIIKNIVNNDIEPQAQNEIKEPVEFDKDKCFFTFDFSEFATAENVNLEISECMRITENAFNNQKDYLLKNSKSLERDDYESGFREFTQDELDLLNFNHNFNLKKCRDIISKLKRLKNLIDTNHMFINLRKAENYYIEEIGKFSATEPTAPATEPSDYIELNAYERALILYRAVLSVYMSKAEFVEEYKIFIPKSMLDIDIVKRILKLEHYNSYIKQSLCIFIAMRVFRRFGYLTDTKLILTSLFKDIDILQDGRLSNFTVIRRVVSCLLNVKYLRILNFSNSNIQEDINNECLYKGYLGFDMMQSLMNTTKFRKMYAEKIKKQFEKNDINQNILEQCENYLIK